MKSSDVGSEITKEFTFVLFCICAVIQEYSLILASPKQLVRARNREQFYHITYLELAY